MFHFVSIFMLLYFGFYVHMTHIFCEYFFHVQYTELIKTQFQNFLFLRSYFERLSMTGTNEKKTKGSFLNVFFHKCCDHCFMFYSLYFIFSRTYFMMIVYFIPSVISSVDFVKIMVVGPILVVYCVQLSHAITCPF